MEDLMPKGKSLQDTKEEMYRYGIGKWTPGWLQFLNTPRWLLFILCVGSFTGSLCTNGLVGVAVSTLEKRFSLQSMQAGLITSINELCAIPLLCIIGAIGNKIHRPRWLSGGMLVLGLGSLMFALPHFTTEQYRYSSNAITSHLCQTDANTSKPNECEPENKLSHLSNYIYLFIFAMMMMALGFLPLISVGITYLDDCVSRDTSSAYLGVFFCIIMLGAAAAFIGGGFFLELYTDVGVSDMSNLEVSPGDPGWVGAWWIAFLVAAVIALFPAVFLAGYPFEMPGAGEIRKNKVEESHDNGALELVTQPGFGSSFKDLIDSCKILSRNPTLIFSVIAVCTEAFISTGFVNFGPKYVENVFGMTPALAGTVFGAAVVSGGAIGNLSGSYLIKRFSLNCKQLLQFVPIANVVVLILCSMFFIKCDNVVFSGVTSNTNGELWNTSLQASCNAKCQCSLNNFDAVCGEDGITYFSPCHAGCLFEENQAEKVYANCSCIQNGTQAHSESGTAQPGFCPVVGCNLWPLFVFLLFIAIAFQSAAAIFTMSILLRCVHAAQRSLSMGLYLVLFRVLGSIPGPLIYGAVLDKSCLLWEEKCEETGNCLYHDTHSMAWSMLIICTISKLIGAITSAIAWKCYKPYSDRNDGGPHNKALLTTDTCAVNSPSVNSPSQ